MRFGSILLIVCIICSISWADGLPTESGKVLFKPVDDQKSIPERYRLQPHELEWQTKPKFDLPVSGVEVYRLTYPSPIKTKYEANNTVHAEYYRPKGKGPFPGVIVLDVLGGDQKLARGMALHFAQNNMAALFVQMAYYGPRRPPEGVRLLTTDLKHTSEAIRQTVLDCRCAAAWLESRPEVDGKNLGIVGTSLGSFMSSLTASMEPRLDKVVLLLSGGGLVDAYWDHPRVKPLLFAAGLFGLGDTKKKVKELIAPLDPLTYADHLKQHKLLMIAASKDDIVPPKAAQTLWEATGKQKIVWYDTNHIGAAFYLFDAMDQVLKHFGK